MNNLAKQPVKQQNGFSLIEIIMAVVVLAIGLTALLPTLSSTTSATADARSKIIAHWVAMNKLTEIQVERKWPSISKKSGKTEMGDDGTEWEWEYQVTKSPDDDMRRIDIEVYLPRHLSNNPDNDKAVITTLTGYVANLKTQAATTQWSQSLQNNKALH